MAERRMFAKTIIDSDAFLDMPMSARLLYYDLSMRADDDGFINSPKKIMRIVGASEDDLKMLNAKKFIIPFDNGVVVIKHWRIHNYIRKDTYKETMYKDEKALLSMDENNAYKLELNELSQSRIESVDETLTQDRLGKDRLGKDRLGKDRLGKAKERKAPAVYFPEDEKLDIAFKDFMEMRKKIKAPMTDRAINMAIKKLEELSEGDNDKAVKILDQSILNNWKDLYPLKEQKSNKPEDILAKWMNA